MADGLADVLVLGVVVDPVALQREGTAVQEMFGTDTGFISPMEVKLGEPEFA